MNGGSRHGSQPQARTGHGPGSKAARNQPANPPRSAPRPPLPDSGRLVRLLEPVVHAMNMDLESLRVTTAGRRRLLRVVVDADGGVSLDDIALASRELSLKLDNASEMGDAPYTLEVSSPGVDRPLTEPRHWRRATGRLVVAPLRSAVADSQDHEGNGLGSVHGRIVATSARGVTLDDDGATREYAYAELGPGRVQVEFGHFEADRDELDEEVAGESGEED